MQVSRQDNLAELAGPDPRGRGSNGLLPLQRGKGAVLPLDPGRHLGGTRGSRRDRIAAVRGDGGEPASASPAAMVRKRLRTLKVPSLM